VHANTIFALCFVQAIRDKVGLMVDTAGEAGVRVLCLQEAW